MFNFSNRSFIKLLPLLVDIAYAFHKKIVIRKFAGSMEKFWYDISVAKQKKILKACCKSNLVLLETKSGIDFLRMISNNELNISWFPNGRKPFRFKISPCFQSPKKFVFISLVTKTKGIDELLEAFENLPLEYTLDVYGKINNDEYSEKTLNLVHNVTYRGLLDHPDVVNTLKDYDMLVLPSYTEGYPGIIIESFSVGKPVIASNVGGIPEMVTDGYNGKIVSAKSSKELRDVILHISKQEYVDMCKGAIECFNMNYNSDLINERLLNEIMSL